MTASHGAPPGTSPQVLEQRGAPYDLPLRRRLPRHVAADEVVAAGVAGDVVEDLAGPAEGAERPLLVVADGDDSDADDGPRLSSAPDPGAAPAGPPGATRVSGPVAHLLHCAVALQAEDLLRTVGALAVAAHRSSTGTATVDWIAWVERDVRDLGLLASAALAAGARLPAGLDVGGGDPDRPETVIEGLLAGHEEVLRVLRRLVDVGGDQGWADVVGRIAARRGAEAAALRVTVGAPSPRPPERTHVGRSPDRHAGPGLMV